MAPAVVRTRHGGGRRRQADERHTCANRSPSCRRRADEQLTSAYRVHAERAASFRDRAATPVAVRRRWEAGLAHALRAAPFARGLNAPGYGPSKGRQSVEDNKPVLFSFGRKCQILGGGLRPRRRLRPLQAMPSAWLSLLTMTGCERGRNKWFAPKVTLEDADIAPQPTVALRSPVAGSSELQSRAARRGNPARDKAETALRATEKTLISAEETANAAVETREQCREVARLARERLRTSESAYVQGCRTLEQLASDFSEMRYEVEVALARAEAELVSANEAANAALRGMKTAEDTADSLLLVLRQAEMDHESAVHRLARMLSQNDGSSRSGHDPEPPARRLLFNATADQTAQRYIDTPHGGSHGYSPVCAPRPALQSSASASEARRELAACGVVLESCVSESVADALLQVVHRQKAAPSSPNRATPGGAGVGVGSNAPVRLMGFGQSCVLGHSGDSEEGCFTAPTETPAMLQTMRSCEAVALACSSHHALVVTNPQRRGGGEVLAWGEDSGGRLGSGGEAVYPALHVAVPQRVAGLSGVLVSLVACSPLHSLALSIDGELFAWGMSVYVYLCMCKFSDKQDKTACMSVRGSHS